MDRNRAGITLIGLGAVLLLLAVLADPLGIGGSSEFGGKQVAGVVLGAVLVLAGVWLAMRARPATSRGDDTGPTSV